jgi:ABC-2 type transport system permease protein
MKKRTNSLPRARLVFHIARVELGILFFSPVAWLVLALFVFNTASGFMDLLKDAKGSQLTGLYGGQSLTQYLFTRTDGLFDTMRHYFYLYIPLLTMGLISKEISSGSIKLLQSSPVRIGELVLGKYLAMLTISLLFVLILCLPVLIGGVALNRVDWGLLWAALLGFYLLSCAYSAVGLLLSSLTSYQLIAAIGTFIALTLLDYAGSWWQDVDYLREVTAALSMKDHLVNFSTGLVSSKDCAYFISMCVLFTGSTMLVLVSGRESSAWAIKAGRYLALSAIALLAVYLTSRPAHIYYQDWSETQKGTLTANSISVLRRIGSPLRVHDDVNVLDGAGFDYGQPANRNRELIFFEPYQRFLRYPMAIDYTYYFDSTNNTGSAGDTISLQDRADIACLEKGFDPDRLVGPAVMRQRIDLSARGRLYTRQLCADGRQSLLGLFGGTDIQEADMITAIKLLTVKPAVIGMVTGHGERSAAGRGPKDYYYRLMNDEDRRAVVNEGFQFKDVTLSDSLLREGMGLTTLVIADPPTFFTNAETAVITAYIRRGGNLLIAGEREHAEVLRPLIRALGVDFLPGTLVRMSKHYPADLLFTHFAPQAGDLSPQLKAIYGTGGNLVTSGAMALTYADTAGFRAEPFILTDSDTWNHRAPVAAGSERIAYNPAAGDYKKILPVAVTLTRAMGGREQRIAIFGDADYLSNSELGFTPPRINGHLGEELFRWFSYGLFPVDTFRPPAQDTKVILSAATLQWLTVFFEYFLPGIIVLLGAVVLLKRRRH